MHLQFRECADAADTVMGPRQSQVIRAWIAALANALGVIGIDAKLERRAADILPLIVAEANWLESKCGR